MKKGELKLFLKNLKAENEVSNFDKTIKTSLKNVEKCAQQFCILFSRIFFQIDIF
jgi:hypothetical protein